MPAESPIVSIVIATYNWSSVLRYSIRTVLWQTLQDFEILVIGDGCTDDSEQVVQSFGDNRIRWHNLPENSGNQWKPNNKGIELATGRYIAYLGHDDLWHPLHLETLVNTIESRSADAAFAVAELIQPLAPEPKTLTGLSPTGEYIYNMVVPPSTLMHRKAMAADIGGWKDYRTARTPIDIEFVSRAWQHGKRIVPTHEFTVFKFPSAQRPNVYVEKPSHEQEAFIQRIESDPEIRYHELMEVVRLPIHIRRTFYSQFAPNETPQLGEMVENWRVFRGLERMPDLVQDRLPIYADAAYLRELSTPSDITPFKDRFPLFRRQDLPQDGIFIGSGWYGPEQDEWGRHFRWVNSDAEIIITKPTGEKRNLQLEVEPGPGMAQKPFVLRLLDEEERVVADASITSEQRIEFILPVEQGDGAVFKLSTTDGGTLIEGDPRILNFRVWRIGWADAMASESTILGEPGTAELRQQLARAQAELQQRQALLERLDSFRTTSFRYWWHRVRTSPKLSRWLRRG